MTPNGKPCSTETKETRSQRQALRPGGVVAASSRELPRVQSTTRPDLSKITPAEQRVLKLVTSAKTNKEIAAALGISPATVKRHIEKILTKLGLRNRVEVAIFGVTVNGCPHQSSAGCALHQP